MVHEIVVCKIRKVVSMEFDLNYDNALMYHGMKCKIGVESDLTTNSYFKLQLHSEIQRPVDCICP